MPHIHEITLLLLTHSQCHVKFILVTGKSYILLMLRSKKIFIFLEKCFSPIDRAHAS